MSTDEYVPNEDDDYTDCDRYGHDEDLMDESDGMRTYGCSRCGAEWWEEIDD